MPCGVDEIAYSDGRFTLRTSQGVLRADQLVLATGGMAIPQLGATDYALGVARQFGLKVVEPRPALVPLTFDAQAWQDFAALSGVALEVRVKADSSVIPARKSGRAGGAKPIRTEFLEDLLFTHRGLSGPAILQISTFWNPGEPIHIDLAPEQDLEQGLLAAKSGGRQQLSPVLALLWPKRLADQWLAQAGP